jgi:endonuclease I
MFRSYFFLLFFSTSLCAQIPQGYYDPAAGLTGPALKASLNDIIQDHVEFPYTSSGTDVWDILKETDQDTLNPNNVILLYTGWSVNAAQEYNSGSGWNREHVWPQSRGDFNTGMGVGTDVHAIRPTDISVNSARNNRWFAECNLEYIDADGPTGSYYSTTEWLWKPRDAVKGDVARMIFYMAVRYEGENGELDLELIDYLPADNFTNLPVHARLNDLLLWHQQDPVSDWERNRNDIIYYNYQQNRNPFIDQPEFAEAIWGEPVQINEIDGFQKAELVKMTDLSGREVSSTAKGMVLGLYSDGSVKMLYLAE